MAKTINGLAVTNSAASGDFIPIWRAANGDTRKITKANFMGGALTGGGTIATGGFTGTLPATGTLALLATAQTFSALKTFSAGISFGESTLNKYLTNQTWNPTITGSGGDPTITYTTQNGNYAIIGNLCFVNFTIVINAFSGGSGNAQFSLPVAVASGKGGFGTARFLNVDVPAGVNFPLNFAGANSFARIYADVDNGATAVLGISGLSAGDTIEGTGWYFIS